jgi:hypothetical protein
MTKPQLIQVSDFVRSLLPRDMLLRLDGDGAFEIKAPGYWYHIERHHRQTGPLDPASDHNQSLVHPGALPAADRDVRRRHQIPSSRPLTKVE